MAYTNIIVSSSGTAISRSQFGIPVRDAINDLDSRVDAVEAGSVDKPFFQCYKRANQSIPNNTDTAIIWEVDGEVVDTHNMHTSSSLTQIIPNVPGIYRVTFSVFWGNNSSGQRLVMVAKNGSPLVPVNRFGTVPNVSLSQMVTRSVLCNGTTDYITVNVNQNSGGALNVSGNLNESDTFGSFLEVEFIRPLP